MSDPLRIFSDCGDRPELVSLPAGQLAVYSQAAPDNDDANEDAAAVILGDEGQLVLAVADGMGGAAQGAEAAHLALHTLADTVAQQRGALRHSLLDGFERANTAVRDLGTGAACTLTATQVSCVAVRSFQVGDSMAMVVGQRGKLKHQSIPQGPAGYGIASGLLTEREAMEHQERHVILNAVGIPQMHIDVGPRIELARHDTLLLATDGLLDNLYQCEIIEQIRKGPLAEAAAGLVRLCRQRMLDPGPEDPSKPDDLSFMMFRLA